VACVWTLTAACSTAPGGSDDDLANPPRESVARDPGCPVTLPLSPDRYPKSLREQEGKTTWYGDDRLWVDLAAFASPSQVGHSVRVAHAWWTVDASGDATLEGGPPTVRATRLDAPGRRVATVSGHSDDSLAWWPATLIVPVQSCWLVTGERHGTVVRVVVKAG
jgi:hypothetical protein